MRERVLLKGVVSEVSFLNEGTLVPTECLPPESVGESPVGILYRASSKRPEEMAPLHVKTSIPGQTLLVSAHKSGRKAREGKILQVLEKAPFETEALCPHADMCGGCCYQTVPYEKQLRLKDEQVRKLLRPLEEVRKAEERGDFLPIFHVPFTEEEPPLGYRNKMEFSFGDDCVGGALNLGLHRKNAFHDIISAPECRLVSRDIGRILQATQDFFREKEVPYYHTYRQEGVLRHLVVRKSFSRKTLLLNLVTTSRSLESMKSVYEEYAMLMQRLSLEEERVAGILHTVNDTLSDVVKADSTRVLFGEDHLEEDLLGLSFRISPFSFFQTNSRGATVLYELIRSFASPAEDKTIFDLYSGTGTIAEVMAAGGAKAVYGIEIVEEAVEAARENARQNGLSNCFFIAGDVLKYVETLQEKPDLIILDPPREGVHPKALPKILSYEPDQFIYVSCKPTALLRDLPAFFEAGYHLRKIACCDMFPFAGHTECIVKLTRTVANQ